MNTAAAPRPGFVLRGWHVLAGFVLFFGADIAVNTVFMVSAYRTFPGQTSVTPYEDGRAYNQELDQRRAQAALGWRLTASAASDGRVEVRAFDRAGRPLSGLQVGARLRRPATEAGERTMTLNETSPGVYASASGPLSGAWDLALTAHDRAGDKMLAERRLVLP